MAKLEWDKTGKRYYETGTDHGVLYVQKSDGTYEKGVAWDGLTGVTESPSGAEANDLWADNIKYATLRSAEAFGGTIEAYQHPVEFYECDGTVQVIPGVIVGQQGRKPFGLVFRTMKGNDTASESDDGYILHIVYNATASPAEKAYATINDSPEAITFSWEFTTTPVAISDIGTGADKKSFKPSSIIKIDSTAVASDKLTAIEAKLFGSGNDDPTLPDIDTLIGMLV